MPSFKCLFLVPTRISLFFSAGSGASSPLTSPSSPTPPSTAGQYCVRRQAFFFSTQAFQDTDPTSLLQRAIRKCKTCVLWRGWRVGSQGQCSGDRLVSGVSLGWSLSLGKANTLLSYTLSYHSFSCSPFLLWAGHSRAHKLPSTEWSIPTNNFQITVCSLFCSVKRVIIW